MPCLSTRTASRLTRWTASQFHDPGAIEIASPMEAAGDEADDEGAEIMSRVGSEENYSTRPAPSSMAAPSVTFSFAETSDLGDSVSVRDQEMEIDRDRYILPDVAQGSSHSLAAWRAEVVGQSPAEGDHDRGIIVSTASPPRFGYDHGTEPIQNYETGHVPRVIALAARSDDRALSVDSRGEETLQENGNQPGPAPQNMSETKPGNVPARTEEKVEEDFKEYEYERTRLTPAKIRGLVGLFFNILFWGGLYIGLNFAPK